MIINFRYGGKMIADTHSLGGNQHVPRIGECVIVEFQPTDHASPATFRVSGVTSVITPGQNEPTVYVDLKDLVRLS